MKRIIIFLREKNIIGNKLFIPILIIICSIILGICAIVLTVMPCDFNLIAVLLKDKYVMALNILPIVLTLLLLYFVTNSLWISFLFTGIVVFIIAEINRFMMTFRDDIFKFENLLLINEAKFMTNQYELFLDGPSICAIIVIIFTAFICFLFKDKKIQKIYVRIIGCVAVLLLIFGSYSNLYVNNQQIYDNMWHYEFGNQWKLNNQYMSRGVIYSFIHSIDEAVISPPEDYKEEAVENILSKYKENELNNRNKVHVISIMLEAYNDFSLFETIDFINDPYVNYHIIKENSYYGNLYTEIFAAGTITTERSFLTGYRDVKLKESETDSFVRYFKSQGYYTEAMHPCYGWFYDRRNINEYLGFDNFDYHENKYCNITRENMKREPYHNLLSDYDFYDYIINGFEECVSRGQPYFNFSVTYQNHGPYSTEKEREMDYIKWNEGYTEAEYNIVNNYLSGIAKTDEALGKIYDYVNKEDEPIVLMLFGDHNPWLGDGNSVYDMLGINLNMNTPEGAANYYQTPYLFYANEAAKKSLGKDFKCEGNTVSPMFLMAEYFEYIGSNGSQYMNYLMDIKQNYNVINPVYVCYNGEYRLNNSENQSNELAQQQWVEYYMKNKKLY